MIKKEDFAMIKILNHQGAYIKDIAAELGVHPKTVSRALKRGSAPQPVKKNKDSKLEAYKIKIDQLLSNNVWNAMVILRELQAEGYDGEVSLIRRYIQPKRVLQQGRVTVRFETEPGEQLQSDWGEITVQVGGMLTKVDFIVNTLGYSRRFHFLCPLPKLRKLGPSQPVGGAVVVYRGRPAGTRHRQRGGRRAFQTGTASVSGSAYPPL